MEKKLPVFIYLLKKKKCLHFVVYLNFDKYNS